MSYAEDFQTLGDFRTQFDPGFVAIFDDSMVGIPQSHHGKLTILFFFTICFFHRTDDVELNIVPFATYRAEPGKFLIKRYDDLRIGTIGREYVKECPVKGGSIRLLMYEPEGVEDTSRLPAYFHVHGGGWVGGAAQMDGPFLRLMVKELNIIVIDVDYRLAPENPFPTSGDDVWTALLFVRSRNIIA